MPPKPHAPTPNPVPLRLLDREWMSTEMLARLLPGCDANLLQGLAAVADGMGVGPTPLFDPAWYRAQHRLPKGTDALQHYLLHGAAERLDPHPLFSTAYYIGAMPEAGAPGVNPLLHFLEVGGPAGYDCHPLFFSEWYWHANPDVRAAGAIPAEHFIKHGKTDGRDPNPLFSASFYAAQSLDAAASRNLLEHFLLQGSDAGLSPHPGFFPRAIAATFRLRGAYHVGTGSAAAMRAYIAVMGREHVASAGRRGPGLAEPGVVPPPPRVLDQASGTATAAGLRLLAALPRPPLPGPAYQLAKLDAVRADPALPAELAGAMGLGASTPMEQLLQAVGLAPLRLPAPAPADEFTVPVLQRYRAGQLRATERLRLDPARAGTAPPGPVISILLPVYRTPLHCLERAILSVLGQTYPSWELCVVDDGSGQPGIAAVLDGFAALDPRIRTARLPRNAGIAAASNAALRLATGAYIGLLDHDDMLAHDALAVVAAHLAAQPDADWLYSDECKIDGDDIVQSLFPKPDWSPLLLTSVMYTGHLSVYRTALVRGLGGFRSSFDFSQDYDLALRVAEQGPAVVHIRECLYGWRMIEGSAASGGKGDARAGNVAALQSAMDRRGWGGTAVALPTANRALRPPGPKPPLVSIVVPSDSPDRILQTCMSLAAHTAYPRYEVIVVARTEVVAACRLKLNKNGVRFVPYDKPFNFSDKCNAGAAAARGSHLVFFNDDVRVLSPDWLDALLEALAMPGAGAAGPKLLYEDHSIQHAGMVTGVRRLVGTAFHGYPGSTTAHFNLAQSLREVSLVCGACLAMPAAVFRQLGGFDAVNTPIAHSDVDLCLRVREAGLSCVYTPHAGLIHLGHQSIGEAEQARPGPAPDPADIHIMRRFGPMLQDDPYFPPAMRDLLFLDGQEPFQYFASPNRARTGTGRSALLVSHQLSASGAPKVVLSMAQALLAAGWHVLVVSPEDGPFRQRLLDAGADVILEPLALQAHHTVLELARNFDLVVCNTILCWRLPAALAPFTRTVLYAHESELVDELHRANPDFAPALRQAGGVWCGSARSAAALRTLGVDPLILEYGAESAILPSVPASTGPVAVATLASIEPRKGQDLAIKGFLALPGSVRAEFRLHIAGRRHDPHFHDAVQEIARAEPGIRFGGEMGLEEYHIALAAADVVLLPSRDDTLPLVSLDALAAGKVLVCSDAVGTAAYIEDGVSGFILPRNHPDDIAAVLLRVLSARRRWPQIGAAARQVFEATFSEERFRDRLLGLIEAPAAVADAAE